MSKRGIGLTVIFRPRSDIMMAVHLTPFTTAPVIPALLLRDCNVPELRSTTIFTFSIIPYLILFVKCYFTYFFQGFYTQSECRKIHQITMRQ